jgi:hypothetical protein
MVVTDWRNWNAAVMNDFKTAPVISPDVETYTKFYAGK